MVASLSARRRKAAEQAGPLASVQVESQGVSQGASQGAAPAGGDRLVHKLACTTCTTRSSHGAGRGLTRTERPWSTYRAGADNGYLAALDRWIFHLHEQHPGAQAPCLAYLPEAQERLQQRRDAGST